MLTRPRSQATLLTGVASSRSLTWQPPHAATPSRLSYDASLAEVCTVAALISRPGTGPPGTRQNAGASSTKKQTCEFQGNAIDCDPPGAGQWWSNDRQCWVGLADPQPPADDDVWQGNSEGAIYRCTPPSAFDLWGGTVASVPTYFWSPDPPPADAGVNPAELARKAVESMRLVGAKVGATPIKPDAPGVVGIQTWLWIDNHDANSFGPITRTATAGPVSVTATATVARVVWDMGDGTQVTCRGKGTEWTRADGARDSPTCGHTYLVDSRDQPDGAYEVQATTHWEVDWDGAGQAGTIQFTLTGPTRTMPVVEIQALRTR